MACNTSERVPVPQLLHSCCQDCALCHATLLASYAFSVLGFELWSFCVKVLQRKREPEMGCKNMRQKRMASEELILVVLVSRRWALGRQWLCSKQSFQTEALCVCACVWVCWVLVMEKKKNKIWTPLKILPFAIIKTFRFVKINPQINVYFNLLQLVSTL